MDERKRTIRDLREKKRETLKLIDGLLENLGEALLDGAPEDEAPEYRRFLREIGEVRGFLDTLEADRARLAALEGEVQGKEREIADAQAALSDLYADLGARVLDDPAYEELSDPYQKQADLLSPKIKSLEDRLSVIEDKGEANVFSWIGKNAQEMVIRSFLGKSQQNLRRIRASVGEKYLRMEQAGPVVNAALRSLRDEIDRVLAKIAQNGAEMDALREDMRKINESFNPEGSAAKKKQALERRIRQTRDQLAQLCLAHGRLAEREDFAGTWAPPEGPRAAIPGEVREKRALIADYDLQIEKLNASLAIDAQKHEIERMERAIADHRKRISAGEVAILDLKGRIEEANRQIQELMKI
jgi:predicted  nucleic acid-binding Zn-ribbon protein